MACPARLSFDPWESIVATLDVLQNGSWSTGAHFSHARCTKVLAHWCYHVGYFGPLHRGCREVRQGNGARQTGPDKWAVAIGR